DFRQAIELIPEVLAKLPRRGEDFSREAVRPYVEQPRAQAVEPSTMVLEAQVPSMPAVTIEKGDSLSDVISKFFSDPWGGSPKKLMDVREALESYGLNYPKQSVAVALLRLAKGSRIRRFKGEGGEFVYTAATGAVRAATPRPVEARPAQEEAPSPEGAGAQEEQLDLDAPTAN
ncbi:MAG TPA: hypothetical protein VLU99_05145, partial [Nitrososphaerales archaeon]|nr:hypothetical protein [Nitrososphaerales archaeon]